jgi:DNA-binding Xre family transcriptional regulator
VEASIKRRQCYWFGGIHKHTLSGDPQAYTGRKPGVFILTATKITLAFVQWSVKIRAPMSKTIKKLKQVIRDSAKTQYRLAADSGVAESVISRLNTGKTNITIENAERLCDALDHEIILQPKPAKKGK